VRKLQDARGTKMTHQADLINMLRQADVKYLAKNDQILIKPADAEDTCVFIFDPQGRLKEVYYTFYKVENDEHSDMHKMQE
jgi:hypothetical protein